MALPTAIVVMSQSQGGGPKGQLQVLTEQFNLLLTQLRVMAAKLDADAGVTDTNYAALVTDAATSAAPITLVV